MECDYRVKQIQPNHADHISGYKEKWLNEMFENDKVVVQRKYDGERMLIHFDKNHTYCTSRRKSIKTHQFVENQSRLVDMPKLNMSYTIIDCECYSNSWSDIASILHSDPDRAYLLQKTIPVKFACFDCLFYKGYDVRNLPYRIRLKYLFDILNQLQNDKRFHYVEQKEVKTLKDAIAYRDEMITKGNEGCVIKSLDKSYYELGASIKAKRFETLDVVVIDYQKGNGKYSNTVGSLKVGYYRPDTNDFVIISKVNCSTDEVRNWWRDNWSTAKYSVIEVKCQEITSKSLRHPVYVRRRDDKSYTDILKSNIFKEDSK